MCANLYLSVQKVKQDWMTLELFVKLWCLYIFIMVENFGSFYEMQYSEAPSVTMADTSFMHWTPEILLMTDSHFLKDITR